MGSSLKFQLTEAEVEVVREAINHDPRPDVRQHPTAVHLLYLGHRPTEVAEIMAVSRVTIYIWWHRWQSNGLEGLANRARSGRPAKANADYIALLEETLNVSPLELGFDFAIWTINRLRRYLAEKTSILLSYNRFRALLTRPGYEYRQPKHDLTHLQDSEGRELLTWLSKHCPFLNPIERFWLQLKNLVSANQLHLDLDTLNTAIAQAVDNQNTPGHPVRLELQDHFRKIA